MALAAALIGLVILAVLLACFGGAGIAEFRSRPRTAGLPLRIMEIAVGVVSSLAWPSRFWGSIGLSPARLSWTMVWLSLLMAGLALASKYASRTALVLVMLGNGMLVCIWYYNGAYHDVTDDRTDKIDWAYKWDTDDPTDRITGGDDSRQRGIHYPPAIGPNGTIYVRRARSLAAFSAGWLWEIRAEGGICTLPAIADDGTILFGIRGDDDAVPRGVPTSKGLVWAVSPEGKKKWTYEFPRASFFPSRDFGGARSPACGQPAIAADGTTYWVGHGVYALTSGGNLRWAFDPGEDFSTVAIAEDGTVYARAETGLFALLPNGAQKWKYSVEKSNYFLAGLAVGTDGTVYLTSREPEPMRGAALFAIRPQGTLKWRNQAYDFTGTTLVASDGTIYENIHLERDFAVVAFDPEGKAKWSTPEASHSIAISSDGTLFICYIHDVLAMSSRGNMLWKVKLPKNPDYLDPYDPTEAVTLTPNGRFYMGDFLGRLGTFVEPSGLATSGWPAKFHDNRNTARAGAR